MGGAGARSTLQTASSARRGLRTPVARTGSGGHGQQRPVVQFAVVRQDVRVHVARGSCRPPPDERADFRPGASGRTLDDSGMGGNRPTRICSATSRSDSRPPRQAGHSTRRGGCSPLASRCVVSRRRSGGSLGRAGSWRYRLRRDFRRSSRTNLRLRGGPPPYARSRRRRWAGDPFPPSVPADALGSRLNLAGAQSLDAI